MSQPAPTTPPTAETIQEWIIAKIVENTGMDPETIDPREPFARYGLDSMTAVTIVGDLEDWLGIRLSATLLWDYPTIESLSAYLAGEAQKSA